MSHITDAIRWAGSSLTSRRRHPQTLRLVGAGGPRCCAGAHKMHCARPSWPCLATPSHTVPLPPACPASRGAWPGHSGIGGSTLNLLPQIPQPAATPRHRHLVQKRLERRLHPLCLRQRKIRVNGTLKTSSPETSRLSQGQALVFRSHTTCLLPRCLPRGRWLVSSSGVTLGGGHCRLHENCAGVGDGECPLEPHPEPGGC